MRKWKIGSSILNDWHHRGSTPECVKRGPPSFERGRFTVEEKQMSFYHAISGIFGHKFDAQGLHPLPKKVKGFKDAPQPQNVSDLKSYLGLLSYYSKFLPNLTTTTLAPLYEFLQASTK